MDYISNLKEVRESKVARGSRHSLYVNRTYFGLYSILSDLKAKVVTSNEYTPANFRIEPSRS